MNNKTKSRGGNARSSEIVAGVLAALLLFPGPTEAGTMSSDGRNAPPAMAAQGRDSKTTREENHAKTPPDLLDSTEKSNAEILPAETRRGFFTPATVTGTILLASFLLDSEIHRRTNKSVDGRLGTMLDGSDFGRPGAWLERLGRPETTLVLSGFFYAGGALAGSPKTKGFAAAAAEATLVSGVAVLGVKFLAGRKRPDPESDADQFRLFSGTKKNWVSFPSGHTTTAFTLAAVAADQYASPWVAIPAYALAGLVGFSRVYQARHWASDIVSGALVGCVAGKAVSRRRNRSPKTTRFYSDGRGLYLGKSF